MLAVEEVHTTPADCAPLIALIDAKAPTACSGVSNVSHVPLFDAGDCLQGLGARH